MRAPFSPQAAARRRAVEHAQQRGQQQRAQLHGHKRALAPGVLPEPGEALERRQTAKLQERRRRQREQQERRDALAADAERESLARSRERHVRSIEVGCRRDAACECPRSVECCVHLWRCM